GDENLSDDTTIHVTNVAPTATISNNGPINEGGNATATLSSPVDPSSVDAASLHYVFSTSLATRDAAKIGRASCRERGSLPTIDLVPVTTYARIPDQDGSIPDYHTTIAVTNVAPTATISNNGPINEGGNATATLSSPVDPSSVDAASLHYVFSTSLATRDAA